jgi:hypothetical protein
MDGYINVLTASEEHASQPFSISVPEVGVDWAAMQVLQFWL